MNTLIICLILGAAQIMLLISVYCCNILVVRQLFWE